MVAFLYYPFYLFLFWYKSILGSVLGFFIEFNRYTASLLSTPLLIKTFFRPLKNEYRQGLVVFSVVFGMVVKSFLIFITTLILLFLILVEVLVMILLVCIPPGLVLLTIKGRALL